MRDTQERYAAQLITLGNKVRRNNGLADNEELLLQFVLKPNSGKQIMGEAKDGLEFPLKKRIQNIYS